MACEIHKLVADVAIIAGGRVLLVKYRDVRGYDGQRGWFLPDDYLVHGEHPADGALRIGMDQAGIALGEARLAEIESFGGEKLAWHLVFHYRADLDAAPALRAGENVADAEWFAVDALPEAGSMAHHGWAGEVLGRMLATPTGP